MSGEPMVRDLSNGVRFIGLRRVPTKTTCLSLELIMPLGDCTAEYMVLSSYLTHCTAAYPTLPQLNAYLESLYGATLSCASGRRGEGFCITLAAACINDAYTLNGETLSDAVLELLLDLLFSPYMPEGTFSPAQTEMEVRLCAQELESEINDKRAYALRQCIETMCADELYGIRTADLLEQVRACTPERLLAAWRRLLTHAHIAVCAAGDVDLVALEKKAAARFEKVQRTPVAIETVFVEAAEDVTERTEEMPVNQSKLVLGFRSGMTHAEDDFYAYRVMTDLFGGGPYSRLFTHVRERLSLCYYCSARLDAEKGLLLVQSGIEAQNKQAAYDEILRQLQAVRAGEFSDADLEASKVALTDAVRGISDTPETELAYYARFVNKPIRTPQMYMDGLAAVTRADVVAAANRVSLDTVYFLCGREEA